MMAGFVLSPLFVNFKVLDRRLRPIRVEGAELIGQRFNRLLAVAHCGGTRDRANRSSYLCLCDCGNFTVVVSSQLRDAHTKSCGCLKRETAGMQAITHGASRPGKRWPEYGVWCQMRNRCYNPNQKSYKDYGGRGIQVHKLFHTFEGFIDYMGRSNGLTLDRLDNDGDYAPGNVRWATREEQAANQRKTVLIDVSGIKMPLYVAARTLGKSLGSYYELKDKGLTPQQAFDKASFTLRSRANH